MPGSYPFQNNLEQVDAERYMKQPLVEKATRIIRAMTRSFALEQEELSVLAVPKLTRLGREVSKTPRLIVALTAPQGLGFWDGIIQPREFSLNGVSREHGRIFDGRLARDTQYGMDIAAYKAMVEFAKETPDMAIPDLQDPESAKHYGTKLGGSWLRHDPLYTYARGPKWCEIASVNPDQVIEVRTVYENQAWPENTYALIRPVAEIL